MRKEKSAAGRGHRLIVLLLLFVILLLAAIACGLSLRLYRRSDPTLAGRWRMEVDVTDSARMRANAWLQAAKSGDQIDAGTYLPQLTVRVELRLNEDGRWSRSVDEASLRDAGKQAERALGSALRELLRLRIKEAGRPVGSDAELDARIEDAVGMSVEAYLQDYGPALLPEDLNTVYDGGGSWQLEGTQIRFDGGAARYLADDALLVLAYGDRMEVYSRA